MKSYLAFLFTTSSCLARGVAGFAPATSARGWTDSSSHLHATWSDNRATMEYQEFLQSGKQEIEKAKDGACVIVKPLEGSTTVADALVRLGQGDDMVLTSDQDIPADAGGSFPVYVTVPPTQLREYLKNLPDGLKARREDLVFFSGGLEHGNIESILKDFGLARDSTTQVLITGIKVGAQIEDTSVNLGLAGDGTEKWAGECAACGKWCGAIENRLESNAIRCRTGFYREWKRLMWEETAMDAVFHLVGAVRAEPTTIADVALYYGEEVSSMLWEINNVLRGSRAITLTYGFEERMFGMAEARGADQPCTLVDAMYPFLYEPFEMSNTFLQYLSYAQDEKGLLPTVAFSRRSASNEKPKFIQGNLRADGVV